MLELLSTTRGHADNRGVYWVYMTTKLLLFCKLFQQYRIDTSLRYHVRGRCIVVMQVHITNRILTLARKFIANLPSRCDDFSLRGPFDDSNGP